MPTPRRLTCVAYADRNSVRNQAYEDLVLGHSHSIVACNAASFGASVPGDRVIITALRGKQRYFVVGQILERIYDCALWAEHGGLHWEHAFLYRPLTDILPVTPALKDALSAAAATHGLNAKIFFNPLYCSSRLNPLLDDLLAKVEAPTDGNTA